VSNRVASIFKPERDYSAAGSVGAREFVLKRSIVVTLQNPLTGVGPGNFRWATNIRIVPHNTFTHLSSEAGIPALVLYVLMIVLTFRNLRCAAGAVTPESPDGREIQSLATAMRASLVAYLIGAFFAGVAYELVAYLPIAYGAALRRAAELACNGAVSGTPALAPTPSSFSIAR
jgi:O-antigen ligase